MDTIPVGGCTTADGPFRRVAGRDDMEMPPIWGGDGTWRGYGICVDRLIGLQRYNKSKTKVNFLTLCFIYAKKVHCTNEEQS